HRFIPLKMSAPPSAIAPTAAPTRSQFVPPPPPPNMLALATGDEAFLAGIGDAPSFVGAVKLWHVPGASQSCPDSVHMAPIAPQGFAPSLSSGARGTRPWALRASFVASCRAFVSALYSHQG